MDYTVGQDIAYVRFHHFSNHFLQGGIAKIKKINRWGHIELDNGKVFDKAGRERNNTYHGLHLIDVSAYNNMVERKRAAQARNTAKATISKMLQEHSVDREPLEEHVKQHLKQLIDQL